MAIIYLQNLNSHKKKTSEPNVIKHGNIFNSDKGGDGNLFPKKVFI